MTKPKLSPNSLAFIALTNEYCEALERVAQTDRETLVAQMLKLLPRIYITASDLEMDFDYSDYEITPALDEETYDQVREMLAQRLEPDDVYLETFVEDMKYSDTPVAVTMSENLADLFQEFYNLIATLRDAPDEVQLELLGICKSNFKSYWGQTLCNVLRALHTIFYSTDFDNDNYLN